MPISEAEGKDLGIEAEGGDGDDVDVVMAEETGLANMDEVFGGEEDGIRNRESVRSLSVKWDSDTKSS